MHVLVPVKRVIDANVKVRVRSDGSGVDTAGVKMSLNPFDEVAVEQAVRLREQGLATKVTVVACGAAVSQDVLRTALAMGADAALLVDTASEVLDPFAVATLLKAVVEHEQVGLVICGKQDIDDDLGATAPMLAALLDWPQAISVNRLALEGDQLQLSCDGDAGQEQWLLPARSVLSVDLRLCDPRSISLPNMMKAKKAPIRTVQVAELATLSVTRMKVVGVAEPAARPAGKKVDSLEALLAELQRLPALAA